jgi:hypothetical protein
MVWAAVFLFAVFVAVAVVPPFRRSVLGVLGGLAVRFLPWIAAGLGLWLALEVASHG